MYYKCNQCGTMKVKSDFSPRKANSNKGIDGTCKACHTINSKTWYDKQVAAGIIVNDARSKYKQDWYQRNKIRLRAIALHHTRKRNLIKQKACPTWLSKIQEAQIKALYIEAKKLEELDGIKRHVDHIIPLNSPVVCGLHVPWNLRVITDKANRQKGNRICLEDVPLVIEN